MRHNKPTTEKKWKRWCKKCKKVRQVKMMVDRDAWTCGSCKTVTTGLEEITLRHGPGPG